MILKNLNMEQNTIKQDEFYKKDLFFKKYILSIFLICQKNIF